MNNVKNSVSTLAMPYMKKYIGKTFVIKYGGSVMKNVGAKQAFIEDIVFLRRLGINVIIVHGGGPEISKWLDKSGIESKFINGLRVTDADTMEIVEMVLSGHINKRISGSLSLSGVNAVGISGRDCNLIQAHKKFVYDNEEKIDIGYVGEIENINEKLLKNLLSKKQVPIVSPIGSDSLGNIYNINADYAASYISAALNAEKLIILTDVEGVYKNFEDKSSIISSMTVDDIKEYIKDGTICGGMIPKMECCMYAASNGTKSIHLVDGRKKHSVLLDLVSNLGTHIITKDVIEECQKAI